MTNKSDPPEGASYAQAKHAHERRKAVDQYKDQLEQGVQIGAELEKAHSADGEEAQAETSGPIAVVLELLSGPDAADLAHLSEAAAARHAELKSALTPERKTALRDLETGKGSTLATARIFRSAPQLLDVLLDTPLVRKVRELAQMLNAPQEWDGYPEDKFWTLGQTILWLLTRDPWVVDQASNDTGGQGESFGEIKAAILIDLLNLQREDVQDAARKLRRRCLNGLPAINGQDRPIPEIEWRHLKIVLHSDNTPCIVRRGQSSIVPAHPDVGFSRVKVLREFPPEERSESPDVKLVEAYNDVVQRHEREGRRRYEGDRRAKRIERIEA